MSLCAVLCASAQFTPEQLAYQLSTRYTPHADLEAAFDVELLAGYQPEAWWSTPNEMRQARGEDSLPLEGLHLAIDPGHIGGIWAQWEARNFRISEGDHWVREGELVFEVAQRVEAQLVELGAEVNLLRDRFQPINPKPPIKYMERAYKDLEAPKSETLQDQIEHALAMRNRSMHLSVVVGELAERARLVNQEIRPDVLVSLHINAAPWPPGDELKLVKGNHAHVLIFGCLSHRELSSSRQQEQLIQKLTNGSGPIEEVLGRSLGDALTAATQLPASEYQGLNAIRIDPDQPYLWARNLMLLRLSECPTILLEPYIANSETVYARLQEALQVRADGESPKKNDLLIEYADAVVAGILDAYGG